MTNEVNDAQALKDADEMLFKIQWEMMLKKKATQAAGQPSDVRADLVERMKAEIAAGTYETPKRLDIAVDRLLDDLEGRAI
jgi:anti-sigma28 factor (negative regulator of flagellin synthesis)